MNTWVESLNNKVHLAMAWLAHQPRWVGLLILLYACGSMLYGARYRKPFLALLCGAAGAYAGMRLGRLMLLPVLPMSGSLLLLIPFLMWPLLDAMMGALLTLGLSIVSVLLARALLPHYQGALLAVSVAMLVGVGVYRALRESAILFYALLPTLGVVVALGTVLRWEEGSCLSPGGYGLCSGTYVTLATVLVVTSVWFQTRDMFRGDRTDYEQRSIQKCTTEAPRRHHGRQRKVGRRTRPVAS